jgi:hypothetical protein
MIYQLSLQATGLAAGILLLVSHTAALFNAHGAMRFAKALPRSRVMAAVLLAVASAWAFVMVRDLDLGEFSRLRSMMLIAIVAGAILSWIYVEEFLAVRALGMILLLAAEPLLESAMLRNESSRLLLTLLAYLWASAGLFFVGMPYLLRDLIAWFTANPLRWKISCLGGIVYGIALIACATLWW